MQTDTDEPTPVGKLDVEQVMRRARERRSPEARLQLVRSSRTELESSPTGAHEAFLINSRLNQGAVPEKYRLGDWDGCSAAETLRPWANDVVRQCAGGRGWILSGSVGTGKSTAAGMLAMYAATAGLSVRWELVPTMLDQLEDRTDRKSAYGRQRQVDLLIWDDFGVESLQHWQIPLLERIVEQRYSAMKSMIVTTNVQLALLRQDLALGRILDRWRERMGGIEMGGDSMRRPQ
jgi:DNA replication protein DnaC